MKLDITCDTCGITFKRESREITRSKKKGRKQYCTRTCAGKSLEQLKHIAKYNGHNSNYDISAHSGNRKDEFTPFKSHLRRAYARNHDVNLTLQDLKEQWEKQSGLCIYTNIKLVQPSYTKNNDPRYTASLDRIDSSLGYIKGNIQFVAMAINYMKSTMSDSETKEFIKNIKNS